MSRPNLPSRAGVAELYSGVLLVGIVLSLSYTIYALLDTPSAGPSPMLKSRVYTIYGSPSVLSVRIDSSTVTRFDQLSVDSSFSSDGVLALHGQGYTTTTGLCDQNVTTFFSVFSPVAGTLRVQAAGKTWIDGSLVNSLTVLAGWHEVMIGGSTVCTVTLPGGGTVSPRTSTFSSVPLLGLPRSNSFSFFLPFVTAGHSVSAVFDGGVDSIAF